MTSLFRILLILFGYFLILPTHAQDTLKIVASDEWGVELELQLAVPQVQLTELTGDDQQSYLRLQIADWFTTDKVGFPELPRIATLLQVPESGELHATVLTQQEHQAFVPAIYPVPTVTQHSGQGSPKKISPAFQQRLILGGGYRGVTLYHLILRSFLNPANPISIRAGSGLCFIIKYRHCHKESGVGAL